MAAPTDTRLGPGTLKLGAPLVDFGAQIASVTLEPSQNSEDGTPTLGNPDPLPDVSESWVLSGSAVQDFEDPDGFVNYCMDHALTLVPFEWTPNTDAAVVFTGSVLVTSIPIGGDVSAQNTSDFEFAVDGTPDKVVPGAAPSSSTRAQAAARARRRSTVATPATDAKAKRPAGHKVTT